MYVQGQSEILLPAPSDALVWKNCRSFDCESVQQITVHVLTGSTVWHPQCRGSGSSRTEDGDRVGSL